MLDVVLKARRQDQFEAMSQHLQEGQMDHEDCDSFVTPLFLLPHVLNLGTRFLFSGGELSQP